MLLGTLGTSLPGNLLESGGVDADDGVIQAGKETTRARQDF